MKHLTKVCHINHHINDHGWTVRIGESKKKHAGHTAAIVMECTSEVSGDVLTHGHIISNHTQQIRLMQGNKLTQTSMTQERRLGGSHPLGQVRGGLLVGPSKRGP